jgi:hypothetical protein
LGRQSSAAIFEFFKTILGDAPKTDLFDGIDVSWTRVKQTALTAEINAIQKNFDAAHPEKAVPALVALYGKVEQVKDIYWRDQKLKQLRNLVAACAGLWFESYAAEPTYAVGEKITVNTQVVLRNDVNAQITTLIYPESKGLVAPVTVLGESANKLEKGILKNLRGEFTPQDITQPYWLAAPHGIGMYTLPADTLAGNPENPGLPKVAFSFLIAGREIPFERTILYKYTDPVRGEVYQPIEVTPPVTANIENKVYLFKAQQPQTIRVKLKSFVTGSGSISMKPVQGWKISPAKIDFTKTKGDEWVAAFSVTPANSTSNATMLEAMADVNGKSWQLGLQHIKYEHIPNITFFPPAETKLVYTDLKTAGNNLGYIAGAGDRMPDALRQAGYIVHMLNEDEIMNSDLSVYDAIIAGVRAYSVNERLAYEQPTLMEYVKNGGTYLVQYNTPGSLVTDNIGPYPFNVVNQRVTEEDAKVTILEPQNAIFNYPNKITNADFNDWIQERGLYFVSGADAKYSAPLQMNDIGMAPNTGSLIVADYGKGRFVYTSLAFFRELPAGVPGAYRLFVNLLSKPGKQVSK